MAYTTPHSKSTHTLTMLILALGDLYVPERAADIPSKFKKLLQPRGKIDKVLCLGNITSSQSTIDFLKSISNDFQMVRGEFDDDLSLSQSLVFTIDNLKIGILNGFQIIPKNDPLSLLTHARMMDVDVLIYGSTHKVEAYTLDGKFFINPGTATGAYSTDPLDAEDKAVLSRIRAQSKDKGSESEANADVDSDTDDLEEFFSPCPSFCLLDTSGSGVDDAKNGSGSGGGATSLTSSSSKDGPAGPGSGSLGSLGERASCTLYLYTLVDDEVKIDRLSFTKE